MSITTLFRSNERFYFSIKVLSLLISAALVMPLAAGEFQSLFDGKTLSGWTAENGGQPGDGWVVRDGELHLQGKGGNLISEKEYTNFELEWEWKLSEGGNNGVKYWVTKVEGKQWLGIEYQMLDDEKHPDGAKNASHRTAAFYDIQAPSVKTSLKPVGEWNLSRVIAQDGKIQHWLNGVMVGEVDTNSDAWKQALAQSKFKNKEGFAPGHGHIMITDHNDPVVFRKIRIRDLDLK